MAGASSAGSRLVKTPPRGGRGARRGCGCGKIACGNAGLARRATNPGSP
jgi:hypothetical protein